jgi:bifunctional enzyme CysN/CysC
MQQPIIRALTCGSVDDGKSTLIGRLLVATDSIPQDTLEAARFTRRSGSTIAAGEVDYSLLTDGLEAEREQGITIDVAYRSMQLGKDQRLILADAPGHEQYTRNMAVAASNADIALVLVDATKGVREQTQRHLTICSVMRVEKIIIIINKLDQFDYSQDKFDEICNQLAPVITQLKLENPTFLPVSALYGQNLASRSEEITWYKGECLLELIKGFKPNKQVANYPRLDITLNKNTPSGRVIYGRVFGGRISKKEKLQLWPAKKTVEIAKLFDISGEVESVGDGQSVALQFTQEIDAPRGDILTSPDYPLEFNNRFKAQVIWLNEAPLIRSRSYTLISGVTNVAVTVTSILRQHNFISSDSSVSETLAVNQIGEIEFVADSQLALETYSKSKEFGNFILVDRATKESIGAGMVIAALGSGDITTHSYQIGKQQRSAQKQQSSKVIWLTGLSGSGKSTIANELSNQLFALGKHVYVLDGDNLRSGLNIDLGFTPADRAENVRRVSQVAKLMVDAGLIVIVALVSPYLSDRQRAKSIFEADEFFEIFVDTPLEICQQRDSKGLYKKAKDGKISNLSGVGQEYEVPTDPNLVVDGSKEVAKIVKEIMEKII